MDPLLTELNRQFALQKTEPDRYRVNWTQFQMAITEQAATIPDPEAARLYLGRAMQQLRHAMEAQFGLATLDSFIAKNVAAVGFAPIDEASESH